MAFIWPLLSGIAALLLVPLFNAWLFSKYLSDQLLTSEEPTTLLNAYDSLDNAISMLTTVSLGVFVVVGFVVTSLSSRGLRPNSFELLLCFLFLLIQALSVNMGYLARMEMTGISHDGMAGFSTAYTFTGMQALFLHVAFSISVSLSVSLAMREAS